jgi:hypothetical protein
MILRKREDTGNYKRGSTWSHYLENSLWKRLRTCRKTDYRMNVLRISNCGTSNGRTVAAGKIWKGALLGICLERQGAITKLLLRLPVVTFDILIENPAEHVFGHHCYTNLSVELLSVRGNCLTDFKIFTANVVGV